VLSSHDETRTVTRFARLENGSLDVALGTNRAKAALLLTFELPGAVCLYQGEELGLPQVEDLPRELLEDPIVHRTGDPTKGRDGCRVPLPWDDSSDSFGYSATGASWLPQPRNWNALTIDAQNHDKLSFLSFTRALISARAAHVVDLPDEVKWCELGDDIVAFDRGSLRCVLNASSAPVTIDDQWSVLVASRELVDGVLLPNHAVWLIRT
jgi:alpha-glucosidase